MVRAGYGVGEIARTLDRAEATVRGVIEAHRQEFIADASPDAPDAETRGERYLRLHEEAAKIAAANGDAKPAMDMLDRLGLVPETSRDRTLLAISREKNIAQTSIASAYGARGGQHPTVNIGIGFPAQLSAVSQVQGAGLMQVSLASENQRLTGAPDAALEIPSPQGAESVRVVRG